MDNMLRRILAHTDMLAAISAEHFPTNVFADVPEIARMDQLVEFTAEIGDLRQAVPAFL